jgi:hypothetical protein
MLGLLALDLISAKLDPFLPGLTHLRSAGSRTGSGLTQINARRDAFKPTSICRNGVTRIRHIAETLFHHPKELFR